MIYDSLNHGLHSRNGLVRKGSVFLLRYFKLRQSRAVSEEFRKAPPVLANSFPKSGTHLLDQIVAGLPGRKNYGTFLASMTSSFQFRERSSKSSCDMIRGAVPGEIIRAHLFYSDEVARVLKEKYFVHYFISRDPRDVVLSESHYLRSINRWHRLHRYFQETESLADAIMLSIRGLQGRVPEIDYPDIAERFARYSGWLDQSNVCVLKYEDLVSGQREKNLRTMIEFYRDRVTTDLQVDEILPAMLKNMVPERSHTFRTGKAKGWQEKFTTEHRKTFKDISGDLLIQLGYEQDHDW